MTSSEQRREQRVVIESQPLGELWLHAAEQKIPVLKLRDLSPAGARLVIGSSVDVGSSVAIEYKRQEVNLTINGFVIWCEAAPASGAPAACLAGISLLSPFLLLAVVGKQ
jgi:hypothetical protein